MDDASEAEAENEEKGWTFEIHFRRSRMKPKGILALANECYAEKFAYTSDETLKLWFNDQSDLIDFAAIYEKTLKRQRKKKVL